MEAFPNERIESVPSPFIFAFSQFCYSLLYHSPIKTYALVILNSKFKNQVCEQDRSTPSKGKRNNMTVKKLRDSSSSSSSSSTGLLGMVMRKKEKGKIKKMVKIWNLEDSLLSIPSSSASTIFIETLPVNLSFFLWFWAFTSLNWFGITD